MAGPITQIFGRWLANAKVGESIEWRTRSPKTGAVTIQRIKVTEVRPMTDHWLAHVKVGETDAAVTYHDSSDLRLREAERKIREGEAGQGDQLIAVDVPPDGVPIVTVLAEPPKPTAGVRICEHGNVVGQCPLELSRGCAGVPGGK